MRPVFQQVAAPDFSSTSRILANANQSFNQGLNSASNLLEKYQEGKRQKNDSRVTSELAKITDEASLNNYLQSGALDGVDISDSLRDDILGFRSELIGQSQNRASIDQTRAATAGTQARTAQTEVQTGNLITGEARNAETHLKDLSQADAILASTQAGTRNTTALADGRIATNQRDAKSSQRAENKRQFELGLSEDFNDLRITAGAGDKQLFEDSANALRGKLRNSGLFNSKEIEAKISSFSKQNDVSRADAILGESINRLQNPDIVTNEDLTNAIINDPELSNAERVQQIKASKALADGALSSVFQPNITIPDSIQNTIDLQRTEANFNINSNPIKQINDDVSRFKSEGNPTQSLINDLGLANDGETRNLTKTTDFIEKKSREYALEFGVPLEHAVIAMKESFVRDPSGINHDQNRFPDHIVKRKLKNELSLESTTGFKRDVLLSREQLNTVEGFEKQLKKLKRQEKKHGKKVPAELTLQIQALENSILTFNG